MKKKLISLLCIISAITMFVGCTNSSDKENEISTQQEEQLSEDEQKLIEFYDNQKEEIINDWKEKKELYETVKAEMDESTSLAGDKAIVIRYGILSAESAEKLDQKGLDSLIEAYVSSNQEMPQATLDMIEATKQEELKKLRKGNLVISE